MSKLELSTGSGVSTCDFSQVSATTTCASVSATVCTEAAASLPNSPSTQDCCDVIATVKSENAAWFVPGPTLCKDFYAKHLSSKPDFGETYVGSHDYCIRRALSASRANLVHLQPKVRIHDHTLEAALILFKTFSTDQDEADQTVFQEDLYACLWLSAKMLSMRTAAPNRQLMCMATGCAPDVLSWREVEVCKVLDWDMVEILREAGML